MYQSQSSLSSSIIELFTWLGFDTATSVGISIVIMVAFIAMTIREKKKSNDGSSRPTVTPAYESEKEDKAPSKLGMVALFVIPAIFTAIIVTL